MSLLQIIDRVDQLVTDGAAVAVIKPHLANLREQAEALEAQVKASNRKASKDKADTVWKAEKEKLEAKLAALELDLVSEKTKAEADAQNLHEAIQMAASLKLQIYDLQEALEAKPAPDTSNSEQAKRTIESDRRLMDVLIFLAGDGQPDMSEGTLAEALGLGMQFAKHCVERMLEAGVIEWEDKGQWGIEYRLSKVGRAFLAERGLL